MKRNVMMLAAVAVVGVLAVACSSLRAAPPLKAGDRVVFLGDSITEQRCYTRYVMNFFTLRYPGVDITFRNAGWGGDSSNGGLSRLQRDVLSQKPTVVTICFGMNDGGYRQFDPKAFEWYMKGMTGLVENLKKAGVKVVLLTPGCVDDEQRPEFKEKTYNETLTRFAAGVKELAASQGVPVFDLNALMLDVQAKAKAKTPKYTMIPDSVHPSEPGQAVMAYAVLKALGCKDQAASVEFDAAKGEANCVACKVADPKVTADSVTFTRTDDALPTYLDPGAASSLDFFPFTQDFNQYNFKVTGLKAGNWKLTVQGMDVGTFTADKLAAGVNLATMPGPWQKLGEQINELSGGQEGAYFFAWRQLAVVPPPSALKADWDALIKKATQTVETIEAARLKAVADRTWNWSLTYVAEDAGKAEPK